MPSGISLSRVPLPIFERALSLAEIDDGCPYLADRVATLRYLDGRIAGVRYRELLDAGYRRSGRLLYKPVCHTCSECKVLRVPVAEFAPNKAQRRAWKKGLPVFSAEIDRPELTEEKVDLYRRYLEFQHGRKEPRSFYEEYEDFLVDTCLGDCTFELQIYAEDRLAGVGILDQVEDALSTVYFYFDPAWAKYSPGVWSALREIELARERGLRYYYLGYYISGCPSMSYKAQYRPCEINDIATGT